MLIELEMKISGFFIEYNFLELASNDNNHSFKSRNNKGNSFCFFM